MKEHAVASAAPLQSVLEAMEELHRGVQDLQDLAGRDGEAAAIDLAVRRCERYFSEMTTLARSLDPASLRQGEREQLREIFNNLTSGYTACVEELAAAAERVTTQLADLRKKQSAVTQYGKIAGLG